MKEPLRKHLINNYKLYQLTKGHLNNSNFVVEGNVVIGITNCTKSNCTHCNKEFDKAPILSWRLSKSGKHWLGRCTCKKTFKIPITKSNR